MVTIPAALVRILWLVPRHQMITVLIYVADSKCLFTAASAMGLLKFTCIVFCGLKGFLLRTMRKRWIQRTTSPNRIRSLIRGLSSSGLV